MAGRRADDRTYQHRSEERQWWYACSFDCSCYHDSMQGNINVLARREVEILIPTARWTEIWCSKNNIMEFIFIALDIPLGNAARGDVKDISKSLSLCVAFLAWCMVDRRIQTIFYCMSLSIAHEGGTVRVNVFVCLSLEARWWLCATWSCHRTSFSDIVRRY